MIQRNKQQSRFGWRVWNRPHRGSILPITCVLLVALIGFMGVAIYTGLNAYVQNEVQKAATGAAMAGASAFYDGLNGGVTPLYSPALAQTAANNTFNNTKTSNPALGAFQTQLQGAAASGPDGMMVTAQARVPTPFLAPLGLNELQIPAVANARYARHVLTGGLTLPVGGESEVPLDPPLVDGPGPDLHVIGSQSGGAFRGYTIEACTLTGCIDVSRAAIVDPAVGGLVIDRTQGGGNPKRVLYGGFYIDLSATGVFNYNKSVSKASSIRLVDDGAPDMVDAAGNRYLDLTGAGTNTTFTAVEIYHHAVACPDTGACKEPSGNNSRFAFGIR